jgi:cob(I)alamin adenosyltransferase
MAKFFTRSGDLGKTGFLGKGRLPKYDLRIETLGVLDELNAHIGVVRSMKITEDISDLLLRVQKDLFVLMGEVASDKTFSKQVHHIEENHVLWIEAQIEALSSEVERDHHAFIIPGDTRIGAFLDVARAVSRRAERRTVELADRGDFDNHFILKYINRLSSLLYILELHQNSVENQGQHTLAEPDQKP